MKQQRRDGAKTCNAFTQRVSTSADSTFHEVNLLTQTFRLPNGSTLRNRLTKASMSEALATYANRPTPKLVELYRRQRLRRCLFSSERPSRISISTRPEQASNVGMHSR